MLKSIENEKRAELAAKSAAVFNQHGKVLCCMGTGSGKTRLALDLAASTNELWTLLVPKKPLFKTWNDEMIKWNVNMGKKVEMLCYASAHKLENNDGAHGRNVILDEAHRVTERNLPYIKSLLGTSGKLICLSATVPVDKKMLLNDLGISDANTVVYTLDEAVSDDVVADYKIQVIQFPLDNTIKRIESGRIGAKFMVTEQAGYSYVDRSVQQSFYADPKTRKFKILARMRFIYNLPTKLELTRAILAQLPVDARVIIFCGSIQHAEDVCQYTYHSKTTDKSYNLFCAGKINRIAVVNSVAEGVNIPDVDYAVMMQVQSKDLHLIQRVGRGLRKDAANPNKVGKIIILCALGTQDQSWTDNAVASFDPAKIDYISSQQLKNNKVLL